MKNKKIFQSKVTKYFLLICLFSNSLLLPLSSTYADELIESSQNSTQALNKPDTNEEGSIETKTEKTTNQIEKETNSTTIGSNDTKLSNFSREIGYPKQVIEKNENKQGEPTEPSSDSSTTSSASTENEPVGDNNPTTKEVDMDNNFEKNQTTQDFIQSIAEDAREIAGKNDLYASVMIAQAILESASGNSSLARKPTFNLFGIKGTYKGEAITLPTDEDDGNGNMYSIQAGFRKYPSYKESLEDYVAILKQGTSYSNRFYEGTWKSQTTSYKDATAYLTGRYATDIKYAQKLNSLIDVYELTQFDSPSSKTKEETKKQNSSEMNDQNKIRAEEILIGIVSSKSLEASQTLGSFFTKNSNQKENTYNYTKRLYYTIKKGDSLTSISLKLNIPITYLKKWNYLKNEPVLTGRRLLFYPVESENKSQLSIM